MSDESAGHAGKRPLAVYAITERKDKPAIWFKIGVAFANRDGSTNLQLDAFPIGTNRLQIREQRDFGEARPASATANGPGQGRDRPARLEEARSS